MSAEHDALAEAWKVQRTEWLEGSITLNYSIPYELILGDVSADGKSVNCTVHVTGFDTNYAVVE